MAKRMEEERLRVTRMRVSDLMVLHEYDVSPGDWTLISGANAEGKTSIITSFLACLNGSLKPKHIRLGAECAAVKVEFQNGTTVERSIARDGKPPELKVRHPDFGVVSAPARQLGKWIDSIAVDPSAFMRADEKEMQRLILETLPLELTDEEMATASGMPLEVVEEITRTMDGFHALAVIAAVRKAFAEKRKAKKEDLAQKSATAEELGGSMPARPAQDWATELTSLLEARDSRAQTLRDELSAVTQGSQRSKDRSNKGFIEKRIELNGAAEKAIEGIRAKLQADIDAASKVWNLAMKAAEETAANYTAATNASHTPELTRLVGAIGEAKAKSESAVRDSNTRAIHKRMLEEVDVLTQEVKRWQTAVTGLDGLNGRLLETIPIDGMEMLEGVLVYDGVPISLINTSQMIHLCAELAVIRAQRLGLSDTVILDNLEHLDSKSLALLKEFARKSGLQWICGRVTDDPLLVETESWGAAA